MKKRHEIIALLAATAGLGMTTAADAAITQVLKPPTEEVLSGQEALSDESLSRMIQLAEAKGHDRSGNSNAAGSSDKSRQGNGNAKGFDKSGNPNAAGNPDKRGQGVGENDDEDDADDDDDNGDGDDGDDGEGDGHDNGHGHGHGHDHHNPS